MRENVLKQVRQRNKFNCHYHCVVISVGAALVVLSWSTWPFVLTARHVLSVFVVYTPPLLLSCLIILPPHMHSRYLPCIMPWCLLSCVSPLCVILKLRSSCCLLCNLTRVSFCLLVLVLSVWRSCFCNPYFSFFTCLLLLDSGQLSALAFLCPYAHLFTVIPPNSSLLTPGASSGFQQRLSISWSNLRAVQVDYLLANYPIRLIFLGLSMFLFFSLFQYIFAFIPLLLDPVLVSDIL